MRSICVCVCVWFSGWEKTKCCQKPWYISVGLVAAADVQWAHIESCACFMNHLFLQLLSVCCIIALSVFLHFLWWNVINVGLKQFFLTIDQYSNFTAATSTVLSLSLISSPPVIATNVCTTNQEYWAVCCNTTGRCLRLAVYTCDKTN